MKREKTMTLEDSLKELIRHVKAIAELEGAIDELWGVRMITGYIPSVTGDGRGDIMVRRGIEEIEKVFNQEAKTNPYFVRTKELRHNGVNFVQYADDKTGTFVKAGKHPPKYRIVEDDGDE